jgi:hypothetical protein
LRGGDAGAWIGETAFLDWYWNKEKVKTKKKKKDEEEEDFDDYEEVAEPMSDVGLAIHTIVANTDDCELLCWTHKDLEELMRKSADLRSALTRAMTAAIVGKVVNLTVSRSVGTLPTWSTWLDDWKYSGGAKVNIASEEGQPQPAVSTVERQHTDNPVKIANKVVKEQIASN